MDGASSVSMRADLPTGTVTFLFSDIAGSTRLLHELGADDYATALAEHRRVIRAACDTNEGVEVDTQGDAFFLAFPTASGALAAARTVVNDLSAGPIHVRIGIHTGSPLLAEEGYVGPDVHRAARIASAGNGGQVLVSASTAALVGANRLRDLGEHRFKDLAAPERVYQVGETDFPPLKSLYQTNLPIPVTPFVGRADELATLDDLIGREDVRILTLTGPGGTGKTRLATQAAANASERFPDGVWWIPLAQLRDPRLVVETTARVLGSQNGLAEHIGDRAMLLVFDNFEQVIDAATDVADLLAACPHLRSLATSRERLHLGGEYEYPVQPLARADGVALFVQRARSIDAAFEADATVPEICRRLDDLPLAIELAAARVKVLPTTRILERLDQRLAMLTGGPRDQPERQRTLRAAIEWSHDLLAPDEQRLFARLAVFRGGGTLEAAEEVAEADLDLLQSLVDKSLLRHVDGRFRMLQTIRELALERLDTSGEAEDLRSRHQRHFSALALRVDAGLRGSDDTSLFGLIEVEHDNIRAALERLIAAASADEAMTLADAMHRFWWIRGHLAEARQWYASVLELRAAASPQILGRVLGDASWFAYLQGDFETAISLAKDGLEFTRSVDDAWGTATALNGIASALGGLGAHREAIEAYEEARVLTRQTGDRYFETACMSNIATSLLDLGDLEPAADLFEEALEIARAIDSEQAIAYLLVSIGDVRRRQGRIEESLIAFRDGLQAVARLGFAMRMASGLVDAASTLVAAGSLEPAARIYAATARWLEETRLDTEINADTVEEVVGRLAGELDPETLARVTAEGRAMDLDAATTYAIGCLAVAAAAS